VWVATSRGLATFDAGRKTRVMGEREGVAGPNVAGIALGAGADGAGVAVATNKGLTVISGGVARTLTAFQGLPNNHAYAVAVAGSRTYVGTLGGLAEVDAMRDGRVFTVADSKLPHNWVNAVAALDGRVYVGTYGGGVATLLPTGELVAAEETAGLQVNPGAMAVVGRRLYVGTLDRGLYALDVDTGRWTQVAAALSSKNVTAIAADRTYLYLGTENGITRIERSALS
jgi:ligand-binding sensor domain-containing protein